MTIEVRPAMYFFYLLDTLDTGALAWLDNADGEGTVNLKTIQHWTSKFRSGSTDLDDEPGQDDCDKKWPA
jgi:hypothetical protein